MRYALLLVSLTITGCCGTREVRRPACYPERPTLVQRIKTIHLPKRQRSIPVAPAEPVTGAATILEPSPAAVAPEPKLPIVD